MNDSDETLDQPTQTDAILKAIAELSKKIDDFKVGSDAQFEVIRQGIVHNGVAYDRLKAKVLLLRADVRELTEEIRQNKKVLA